MPLNIRSEEVSRLAAQPAKRTRLNKTEAVRRAQESDLQRLDQVLTLWERLRPLRENIRARPSTGLAADEAFYDDLSGDQ